MPYSLKTSRMLAPLRRTSRILSSPETFSIALPMMSSSIAAGTTTHPSESATIKSPSATDTPPTGLVPRMDITSRRPLESAGESPVARTGNFISSIPFFLQAEDGIRDWSVTGVQTCALPIFQLARETGALGELPLALSQRVYMHL